MAAEDVDFAGKPKQSLGSRARSFGQGIWDGEKKEFVGRTGSSWAKIGLFYLVFYACLAGFFAIMLAGFFSTLNDTQPTQTEMYSLIKLNPGMGFRPFDIETTLIRFNGSNPGSYEKYVNGLKEFLEKHNTSDPTSATAKAAEVENTSNKPVEKFDVASIGSACNIANQFGYNGGKPCVLLKINKVFNWKPVPFSEEDLNSTEMGQQAKKMLGSRLNADYIGVTCEGENDGDIDNLGAVEYFPNEGFPMKYYPYLHGKNYRAPLVFVKLNNIHVGAVVQVWCKLWVKNIKHHKNDKGGSVHFEILVDM